MKKTFIFLFIIAFIGLISTTIFAQPGRINFSSEWEATGFNNGRRIVRDSNGYFHAFWHSQRSPNAIPSGNGCDIYYAFTLATAKEPPSMANQGAWSQPVNLTCELGYCDNRYPSVAIEYETWDNDKEWPAVNTLHIVWQAMFKEQPRYEICYANIPVGIPPTSPAPWSNAENLSKTKTDSLVPAIAINSYQEDFQKQHLHVVWQEEDIQDKGGSVEDDWFSDIAYIRSADSGQTWSGWYGFNGYAWDNLTNSATNSQMPTIGCILDQHTDPKHPYGLKEFGYNSTAVHVAYHEDNGSLTNVYYLYSPDDGQTWNGPQNLSGENMDAYPNIAVDMLDQAHIVFMRGEMRQHEPLRSSGNDDYLAGIDPTYPGSFPGPYPGMYAEMPNYIVYVGPKGTNVWGDGSDDLEFPTVALDRWQHLNVNWQQFFREIGDYEIIRDFNLNGNQPQFPLIPPSYSGWSGPLNDSQDESCDDLFPNLAHKKAAMYLSPDELKISGFDEVWTKIEGHGRDRATGPFPKFIMQDGNMTYGP